VPQRRRRWALAGYVWMGWVGTSAWRHSAAPVPASNSRSQAAEESLTYTIGPGDVIQVLV
jgi:hypothetical protein